MMTLEEQQELERLRAIESQVRDLWKEMARTVERAHGPEDPLRAAGRMTISRQLCTILGDSEQEWADLCVTSARKRRELQKLEEKTRIYKV